MRAVLHSPKYVLDLGREDMAVYRNARQHEGSRLTCSAFTLDAHELPQFQRCAAQLGKLSDKALDIALRQHERW